MDRRIPLLASGTLAPPPSCQAAVADETLCLRVAGESGHLAWQRSVERRAKLSRYLSNLHEGFVHVHSPVAVLQVRFRQFVLLDELSVEIPAKRRRETRGGTSGREGQHLATSQHSMAILTPNWTTHAGLFFFASLFETGRSVYLYVQSTISL